jgi:hypothetical protein
MSSRILLAAGLAVVLVAGAVALNAQQAPDPKAVPANKPAAPVARPSAAGPEESLHDVMETMKDRMKSLAAACAAKSKDPALAAVTDMQRLMLVAKAFEPDTVADKPEAERPAFLVDYRKHVVRAIKELAEVELDVLDGNFDSATKRVETNLVDLRDESHDEFKKKRRR